MALDDLTPDDDQPVKPIKPRMPLADSQRPMEIPGPNMAGVKTAVNLPGVQVPQLARDQAAQVQLNKGSGVDQLSAKHPVIGGIAKVADVLGSILAPGFASMIPGTTLHHNALVNRNSNALNTDVEQQQKTALAEQETAKAKELANPKQVKPEDPKAATYQALVQSGKSPQEALEIVEGSGKPGEGKSIIHETDQGIFLVNPDTKEATPLTFNGQPLMPKGKTPNAKEGLQQRILEASEKGDTATVKKLQDELKAIGDPYAQQKVVIEQGRANDSHDAAEQKKKDAVTKQVAPLQGTLDEAQHAHEMQKMADSGNAEADVDLALSFFKVMRSGGQGIRFTRQEQDLILGARNSAGDLQAMAQKVVGQGQKFTPEQRKQIVDVIDSHAKAAQSAMDRISGGKEAPADGGEMPEYVRDPKTNKLVLKSK